MNNEKKKKQKTNSHENIPIIKIIYINRWIGIKTDRQSDE